MSKVFILVLFLLALGCSSVNILAYEYGDANSDGFLTAQDASLLLQKVLDSSYKLPVENDNDNYIEILDVDNSFALTSSDCSYVMQKVLNSAYLMPCERPSDVATQATTEEMTANETTTWETTTETITEETTETTTATVDNTRHITIRAGSRNFDAIVYNNAAADVFVSQLPISIEMNELNENEKYYYFSDLSFPANAQRVDMINAGDLMLYGNDCLVLFYESFSTPYSYTPIGYIENPSGLAEAVGSGDVTVSFRVSGQ